jgi:O-acetyl-ADP-ribose deacetylase (regulator of RNase III)
MQTSESLDLSAYRTVIHLDTPYEPPTDLPETDVKRIEQVNALLTWLVTERGDSPLNTAATSYEEKRRLLKKLLTIRRPEPLPDWFYSQMNRLLTWETIQRKPLDIDPLPCIAQAFPNVIYSSSHQCVLWQGDITRLKVDAIVNAANQKMLGCFQPFHTCIDNVIHCAAGPQVREDCYAIMQLQGLDEETGWAKITRAYNLPSRFILHTVGPIVKGGLVSQEQEALLASSYRACLDLVGRLPAIRSIAFCGISTGVFGFPQDEAARIALQTVDQWLKDHSTGLEVVIFNVFRDEDRRIYEQVLSSHRR